MSYSMNFSGHVQPADPAKDEVIRKAANDFVASLSAAGIPGTGLITTPSGSHGLSSPTVIVRTNGPGGSGTGE